MEKEESFKKLNVWRKSDELAFAVYQATSRFPKDEIYGLTSQMRRAAVSVPANIAEGAASWSKNEKRRFYVIARASLTELEYFLYFPRRLNYISDKDFEDLAQLREETGKLLGGLIKSFGDKP
ncbi:hypothetical protein A3J33_00110 [candidate division WWE3 bacterium RIFCSPLOWO2_02_FULL_53_10]|uniref:Four helix bundle protein n=2 Tax=Katanobacteria TaxID=422282 RepID=A0A1F4WQC4_UNCKA|nr:MAG: hypothetical protein A2890_01500 [candidate division WWE3 bacterium RIFCSPLOWO2_01_FULL_53_14]OGC71614.1 MAG: hypothetical protein A3J33_00110 [candidate division WWE3 bacterium RIFCSPLOWO2_02_FULL_53_10]